MEEDGIQIDPFNLDQERKEGYFDDAGNFVEYLDDDAFKVDFLSCSFYHAILFFSILL